MAETMVHGLIDVPQDEVALLLEAGYLYLELGKPKEAEEVFSGVSALVPHSNVPLLALGNLHFAQGNFQRALKFHQDALKLTPDSALAWAHVGEVQLFLKKPAQAVAALEKALELESEGEAALFARSLLDAHTAGDLG
ncbi:MAG: tetratricopeptide repeat protein [Myxococcota bacterium]